MTTETLSPGATQEDVAALIRSEFASYIEPLIPVAERLSTFISRPEEPLLRREFYRGLITELAAGYFALLYADPKYPDFWPFTQPAFNAYMNNPDDDYYLTAIEDTGVYRISGYRGTVKIIDFQTGKGQFLTRAVQDEYRLGSTLANYDIDRDATVGEDGWFDVILSRERPAGWEGDWWELHEGATNVFNRQISYDWPNEIDGRYGIERLDIPAARPRPDAERLEADLRHLATWVEGSLGTSAQFVAMLRQKMGINVLRPWDLSQEDGFSAIITQLYVYGGFDLEPDEALIVEFQVPKVCRYWSIHLGDDLGFIHDWVHRQTIVNGHTGVLDDDGSVRIVVSAQDPGTPNWLDTIGFKTGAMSLRLEHCDVYPDTYTVTKVKVDEVRHHMPSGTGTVTPEERDALIRRRRLGVQMRKRW